MLHCNKNKFKSMDVNESMSVRLVTYRLHRAYSLTVSSFMFDFDNWTDFRLIELMDKVYGNHC